MSLDSILKEVGSYHSPAILKNHVTNLFKEYTNLKPKLEPFVFNDGRSANLVKLEGTVPIVFKSNRYNIPLSIWFLENYPTVAPLCYVVPTKDMRVKAGHSCVDSTGAVFVPYLRHWNPNRSNLRDLVTETSIKFSAEPPLFKHSGGNRGSTPSYSQSTHLSIDSSSTAHKAHVRRQSFNPPKEDGSVKDQMVTAVSRKLHQELTEYMTKSADEINALFQREAELSQSKEIISNGINALQMDLQYLQEKVKALQSSNDKVELWIERQKELTEVDLSSIIQPADTWSHQLLNVIAEDHAIEDALYIMDRALLDEIVSLEEFLKVCDVICGLYLGNTEIGSKTVLLSSADPKSQSKDGDESIWAVVTH